MRARALLELAQQGMGRDRRGSLPPDARTRTQAFVTEYLARGRVPGDDRPHDLVRIVEEQAA